MSEQGPEFHFEITEVEIARVDCIAALGLKVIYSIQLNKFMKLNDYQRSGSLFLPWQNVTRISKLKLFPRNC